MTFSRRAFLNGACATLGAAATTTLAAPALALSVPTVGLACLHTGRSCRIKYDGSLTSRDVEAFRSVTRDWRADKMHGMDLKLITILSGISRGAGSDHGFGLVSGFRTRATNEKLNGTAKQSLHMQGMAMDIRRSDLSTKELHTLARALRAGGVGFYPQAHNQFVHVDTWKVRYW